MSNLKIRKLLALLTAMMMLISYMPVSLAEKVLTSSEEYVIELPQKAPAPQAEEETGHAITNGSDVIFDNSYKNEAIKVKLSIEDQVAGGQPVGQEFHLKVDVVLADVSPYVDDYHGEETEMLFTSYDHLTITVTAPEGIQLLDTDGNPVDSFTVPSIHWSTDNTTTENLPSSSIEAGVQKSGQYKSITAYIKGNGATPQDAVNFDAFTVTATADTHICQPDPDAGVIGDDGNVLCPNEPWTEEQLHKQFSISPDTSATKISSAPAVPWNISKTTDANQVVRNEEEETVTVTYMIEVGQKLGDNGVNSESSYYIGYGVDVLNNAEVKDKIAPVSGLITQSGLYPKNIEVFKRNAGGDDTQVDVTLTPAGENRGSTVYSGFKLNQNTFNTLQVPESSRMGEERSTVWSWTTFVVKLTYNADEFTYPVSTAKEYRADFNFSNEAEIYYYLASGTENPANDSASTKKYFVGEGGDVSITEKLFLNKDAVSGDELTYDAVYAAWFGGMTYDLYLKDQIQLNSDGSPVLQNGKPVSIVAENQFYHDTLTLNNGVAATKGDYQVPEGDIIIIPNYSSIKALGLVIEVDEDNQQNPPAYAVVKVEKHQTAATSFYLRYKQGAIIHVDKYFYQVNATTGDMEKMTDVGMNRARFEFVECTADGTVVSGGHAYGVDNELWTANKTGALEVPVYAAVEGTYYLVTEKAVSDGFMKAADPKIVFVKPGDRKSENFSNYANEARITVTAWMSDKWDGITWNSDSADGVTQVSGGAYTYTIVGSDGSETPISLASSPAVKYVKRTDANNQPITYHLVCTGPDGSEVYGSFVQNDASKTSGKTSATFSFESSAVVNVDVKFYYQRAVNVNVTKVVKDNYDATSTVSGWSMTLTGTAGDDTITVQATTDSNGNVNITGYNGKPLPVTNAQGVFYTWTVQENIDESVANEWDVTYDKESVTLSTGVYSADFTVTNTRTRGTIVLTKVDADNASTKLKDAEYVIYCKDADGTTHYLSEDGTWADAANEFKTGADGKITVTGVPASAEGITYYAKEVTAPADYVLDDETEITLGVLMSNGKVEKTVTDVHKNQIRITKYLKDQNGKDIKDTGSVTFQVYKKVNGEYVLQKKSDGTEATVTIKLTNQSGKSATITLDDGDPDAEYYILETNGNGGAWLTPDQQKVNGQTYTDAGDGRVFFGPFKVAKKNFSNKTAKASYCTANCTDVKNAASLTVTKKSRLTNLEVAGNTEFRVMTKISAEDSVTAALLKAQGFQVWSESVLKLPGIELAEGGVWYVSAKKTTNGKNSATVSNLPIRDKDGTLLKYMVVETGAPDGYFATLTQDGKVTETPVHADATLNDKNTAYSADLIDSPKGSVRVKKNVKNVWDYVVGNQMANAELLAGVTMTIYHVSADGKLDAVIGSMVTANNGLATFNGTIQLDATERYVVIETDSNGHDTAIMKDSSTLDGWNSEDRTPASVTEPIGKTIEECKAEYGGSAEDNNKIVHEVNWTASEESTDYPYVDSSATLTNYIPYVRLTFPKVGQVRENGTDKVLSEYPLAHCKFQLYTMSAAEYAAAGSPATVNSDFLKNNAHTDGYVYETDETGHFITAPVDYLSGNVYFFHEIEPKGGYAYDPNFVVGAITPEMYKNSKNNVYSSTQKAENWVYSGGDGDILRRYVAVDLEKFVDANEDRVKNEGDWPLADVTFQLILADKNFNPVVDASGNYVCASTFQTGVTEEEDEGYGISESLKLSDYVGGEGRVVSLGTSAIDDVFDFIYQGDVPHEGDWNYAEFCKPEYLKSQFELKCNFLLIETGYPKNITPYDTAARKITVTTGESEYILVSYRPEILNLYGSYVMANVQKLTGDGSAWVPFNDSDYVEFEIIAKSDNANYDDFIQGVRVRIYGDHAESQTEGRLKVWGNWRTINGNAANPPEFQLTPETEYTIKETHTPIGYDDPKMNPTTVSAIPFSNRVNKIVTPIRVTDTEYIDITVTKVDGDGAGVAGKKLELRYSNDANRALAIRDANGAEMSYSEENQIGYRVVGTTDAEGSVTFRVPRFVYDADGTVTSENATYRIFEIKEDGTVDAGFGVMNGTKVSSVEAKTQTIKVANPSTDSLLIKKMSANYGADGDNKWQGSDITGVSFKLYYIPFASLSEIQVKNPTGKSASAFTNLVREGVTGTDGLISWTGLYSGYYRLVETAIPAGHLSEGQTYVTQFVYLNNEDLKALNQIYGFDYSKNYWFNNNRILFTSAAVGSKSVSSVGTSIECGDNRSQVVQTSAMQLNVLNTPMGYLNITKTFETGSASATVPSTVTFKIENTALKYSETITLNVTDGIADYYAQNGKYISLVPATYTVTETVDKAWYVTASETNVFANGEFKTVGETLLGLNTSGSAITASTTVAVSSANTNGEAKQGITIANDEDHHVTVAFTNRTAQQAWKLKKVDDDIQNRNPVANAVFALTRVKNGTTYFYAGQDTTGLGKWIAGTRDNLPAGITRFVTDADGLLDVQFIMDGAVIEANKNKLYSQEVIEQLTDSYTLTEIGADKKYLILAEDVTAAIAPGQTVDWTSEEYKSNIQCGNSTTPQWLEDGTGLYLTATVVGHTYENKDSTRNTPSVAGTTFKLFIVKGNVGEEVAVVNESGNSVTTQTAGEDGTVSFNYLLPLDEKHSLNGHTLDGWKYVLVETNAAENYTNGKGAWDEEYQYLRNSSNSKTDTTFTWADKTYRGYTVTWPTTGEDRTHAYETLYNMPYSTIVVLKYNIDYPDNAEFIPENAKFSVVLDESKTHADGWSFTNNAVVTKLNAEISTEVKNELAAMGYTVTANGYISGDGRFYSYEAAQMYRAILPGTYTVTETDKPDGFFYVLSSSAEDEWCTVKSLQVTDTDGGVTVVTFGNIPNPSANGVSIVKSVSAINGGDASAMLASLQHNDYPDGWQTVTYTISDFAPGKQKVGDKYETPEAVKYDLTSLILEDSGLKFYDAKNTQLSTCESYVVSINVGSFGYVSGNGSDSNLTASVYGVTAGGDKTLLKELTAAGGSYTFPNGQWSRFEIDYNDSTRASGVHRGFKANDVQATFKVRQNEQFDLAEAKLEDVASKLINTARVAMNYDLGISTADCYCEMSDTATAKTDNEVVLPNGVVTKSAYELAVNDRGAIIATADGYKRETGTNLTQYEPGMFVEYVVTFTNVTDAEKNTKNPNIPTPFVADAMPAAISIDTEATKQLWATTTAANVTFDEITITDEGVVYVTTKDGSELKPGESITLHIVGIVNAAMAAESIGSMIHNHAYAGSTTIIERNMQNKNGTPFLTKEGGHPALTVKSASGKTEEAFSSYLVIESSHNAPVDWNGDITILKSVAAGLTDNPDGSHNWKSNSDLAVVEPSDYSDPENPVANPIWYHITVHTMNEIPYSAGNVMLRVADALPRVGDGYTIKAGIRNGNRSFGVAGWLGGFSVSVGGKTLTKGKDYNLYFYNGSGSQSIISSALTGNLGSWSGDAGSNPYAFLVEFTTNIPKDSYIQIAYTCLAPEGAADGVINYNKIATNDSALWCGTLDPNQSTQSSNVAKVTMMPPFYASIGDRVWLDKNANGLQDYGEETFKLTGGSIQLRTKRTLSSVTLGQPVSLASGTYLYTGLRTGVSTVSDSSLYSNYNANIDKLNGSSRYVYQLLIDPSSIPEGYVVTKAYAGNGGNPTVLYADTVEGDDSGVHYFTGSDPQFNNDSDFRLIDGKYKTTEFYLPMQYGTTAGSTVAYLNYDLGLVRTRDLEITKMCENGKVQANTEFTIYGPFESVSSGIDLSKAEVVGTFTTDENGKISIVSDQSFYLNYYSYYLIVETNSGSEFLSTDILRVNGADWTSTANITNGAGIITADSKNYVLLNPVKEGSSTTAVFNLVDEYAADATFKLVINKQLNEETVKNADLEQIANAAFDKLFSFTVASDNDKDNLPKGTQKLTAAYDSATGTLTASMEFSYAVDHYLADGSYVSYDYKLTENDTGKSGVGKDETVHEFQIRLSDPEGEGELVVSLYQDGTLVEDVTGASYTFTMKDPLYHGDIKITKQMVGTLINTDDGDSFTFKVSMTPEKGMEALLKNRTFKLVNADDSTQTKTFTLDNSNTATFDITITDDNRTVAWVLKDIPAGTKVSVEEILTDDQIDAGYVKAEDWKNPTTIEQSEEPKTYELKCENTREIGDLTIKKIVKGNAGEKDRKFAFDVTLTPADSRHIFPNYSDGKVTASSIEWTVADNGTLTATIELADGETCEILGILAGTTYEVIEQSYADIDYTTTKTENYKGTITSRETSDVIAVEYTNERNTGAISLTKAYSDKATGDESLTEYPFTITLTYTGDVDLKNELNLPIVTGVTADPVISGQTVTYTFKIKAGDTVSLANVLIDTVYSIAETDISEEGYELPVWTMGKVTGKSWAATNQKVESIEEAYAFTFTNERNAGELAVLKTLKGNATEEDREFNFTVKLSRADDKHIFANYGETTVEASGLTWTIATDGSLTTSFTLKGDETKTISDILAGTTYTVTEDSYADLDYRTTQPANYTGTVTSGMTADDLTIEYINERNAGAISLTKAYSDDATGEESLKEYAFTIKLTYGKDVKLVDDENQPNELNLPKVEGVEAERKINGQNVTYTFNLKTGDTISLKNILVDTVYSIVETNCSIEGYEVPEVQLGKEDATQTWSVKDQTVTETEEAYEWTFTNERNAGSLTVLKTPEGNAFEDDREFTFTVKLSREDGKHIFKNYGETTVEASDLTWDIAKDGTLTATFVLKGNESKEITDILAGTTYEVTEASYSIYDYETTKPENFEGTVESGDTLEVEYINKRIAGTISLTKQVNSTGRDSVGDFAFELVLTYRDNVLLVDEEGNNVTENLPVLSKAVEPEIEGQTVTYHFTLAHEETLTLEMVLVGTHYVFEETNYREEGFTECVITDPAGEETEAWTAEGDVDEEGAECTYSIENIRRSGDLKITKTLSGNATDETKLFNFTVVLYDTDGIKAHLDYPTVKNDTEEGTATFERGEDEDFVTYTFQLMGGESLLIRDINEGIRYTVTEDDYQVDGYLTEKTGETGTITVEGAHAAYTNSRNLGNLSLTKRLAGNAAEAREFIFNVTLSRTDSIPLVGIYKTEAGEEVEFAEVEGVVTAKIPVRGGTTVTILGIPADTAYTVEEDSYAADDYKTYYVDETGSVTVEGVNAIVTNERNAGTLTITKTVVTNGIPLEDVDREFVFTVTITKKNGSLLNRVMDAVDGNDEKIKVTFVKGVAEIVLRHGESITIKDIPLDATYTVTEKDYVGVTTTWTDDTGVITKEDITAACTNTITQAWTNLTIRKVWDDNDNAASKRLAYVNVRVTGGDYDETFTLNDENGWTQTTGDLPRFDETGNVIIYSVEEVEVPDGYKVRYVMDGDVITITNKYGANGYGITMNEGYCFD